ncbi:MAG TPA: two-component system VirA-like sensor kinase [Dongiaceae bacterium]|nr:two-component system VirA-like sensor kinase [Dongiaceae bacterium]
MKLMPTVAAIPLLLLMLTWLLIKGMNVNSQQFEQAIGVLDKFQRTESALHRDILAARSGMLRNYDPLVREVNVLRDALAQLEDIASGDLKEETEVDRLSSLVDRQEDLTEQFKSNNALLQNSLAYFSLFSARLGTSGKDGVLVPAVSALAAAMLNFTLNTSPSVAQEVQDRLDDLARQPVQAGDADSVETLLAHGRLLHDLLPATDDLVKALFVIPSKQAEERVRSLIVARHDDARRVARRYRLLLYVTSLLLMATLVHLGLRLRARAQALRRRAALEHVIAAISTGFINCRPHEIDAYVDAALDQLAEHIDADRAYYVIPGKMPRVYLWCREGAPFPSDWPENAPAVAAGLDATMEGIIYIPAVATLPPDVDREPLNIAGLSSWICVPRLGESEIHSLLGFDFLAPRGVRQVDELGLLRMALDAISNAVERTSLEQERARLETRLQQARRMETVGTFASGIAHNFNNIVAAILGYTEIAEAQVASSGQAVASLEEIRKAGERARDLVDQILAFGRHREGHRRPVDIGSLIAEVASLLQASLPPTTELVIGRLPETANILGEPGQLQQVILNLCNNAAQAMEGVGRIEIDVQIHDIPWAQPLTHGELTQGRYVSIGISDTGRGMQEAVLERLFEPFFTTRPTGNGLGLASAREIVRQHGGAMNVRSSPGAGSRFEAWLPCIGGAEIMPKVNAPALPFGRGEALLVVGDDRNRLLADEEVLAALGYEPIGFTSTADVLAAYRADPGRFDCLVLGHFSSIALALDLAAKVHEITPTLPILLTTTSIQEIDASLLISAGISEAVRRPLISTELAAALKRCFRSVSDAPRTIPT